MGFVLVSVTDEYFIDRNKYLCNLCDQLMIQSLVFLSQQDLCNNMSEEICINFHKQLYYIIRTP